MPVKEFYNNQNFKVIYDVELDLNWISQKSSELNNIKQAQNKQASKEEGLKYSKICSLNRRRN